MGRALVTMTGNPAGGTPPRNDAAVARLEAHHRAMWRIRAFEEAAGAAYRTGAVPGFVHLSIGQEAVAVGVCANLGTNDVVTSTHRGHGHTLAKGGDLAGMMAEIYGKATGTCGGKGGSMHVADFRVGMLGANGVVAAGLPIAVGAAQAIRLRGLPHVAVTFFGDGATNRGPFFESLNWARVYDLPVLFVCEDNGFAATTRTRTTTAGPGPLERARAFDIPGEAVDGNDVEAVDTAAAHLLAEIRAGGGPRFLVATTYRLSGHISHDPATYRPADEVAARWTDEPIARVRARLEALGVPAADLDAAGRDARAEVAASVEAALAAPWPAVEAAYADVSDRGAGPWR